MVSNTDLNSNYNALSQLPIVKKTLKCVRRLIKENKEIKKENEMLKKMIDTLFDRQTKGNSKCCGRRHKSTQSPLPEVHIKKEKNIIDISNEPENITYELRDSCNTTDKPFTYGDETNDMVEDIKIMDIKELEEEVEVEVEESEEEVEVEVEVEESEEEVEIEVEVEESEEEVEVEVEVEESEEEVEVEVEVEESEEEVEIEVEVEESEEEVEVEVEVEESEEEVEVEVEESEEEVEVEVEESEEEVEVEVEESAEEEEADEEVYELTIKNKSYYVSNETDGPIYAILEDEDIGDQIGEFKKGKPTFYKKAKK